MGGGKIMRRYNLPYELHERVDYNSLCLGQAERRYNSVERRIFAPLMECPCPWQYFVIQTKRKQGLIVARSKMEAIDNFLEANPDEASNIWEPNAAEEGRMRSLTEDRRTSRGTYLKLEHGPIFFGDIFVDTEPKPDTIFTWSAPTPIGGQMMSQYTIQLNAPQSKFIKEYQEETGEKFVEKAIQRLLSGTHQLLDQGRLSPIFSKYIGEKTGHTPILCSKAEVRKLELQGRENEHLQSRVKDLQAGIDEFHEQFLIEDQTPLEKYGKSPIAETLKEIRNQLVDPPQPPLTPEKQKHW